MEGATGELSQGISPGQRPIPGGGIPAIGEAAIYTRVGINPRIIYWREPPESIRDPPAGKAVPPGGPRGQTSPARGPYARGAGAECQTIDTGGLAKLN